MQKNRRPEEERKIREIMDKNNEAIGDFGGLPITKSYPFPNFESAPMIVAENASGEDFVLTGDYAWISVGNHSVRINKTDLRLKIGVWERDKEDQDPIDQITLYHG